MNHTLISAGVAAAVLLGTALPPISAASAAPFARTYANVRIGLASGQIADPTVLAKGYCKAKGLSGNVAYDFVGLRAGGGNGIVAQAVFRTVKCGIGVAVLNGKALTGVGATDLTHVKLPGLKEKMLRDRVTKSLGEKAKKDKVGNSLGGHKF